MKGWLLDTNIFSELRRPRPSEAVVGWVSALPRDKLHTASVCIAEIRHGIAGLADPYKQQALQFWLETQVRPMFEDRVIDASEDILVEWRGLSEHAIRSRRPAPAADLLIAATARISGLAVATRDTAPFAAAGIAVFNPFTGERFNGA